MGQIFVSSAYLHFKNPQMFLQTCSLLTKTILILYTKYWYSKTDVLLIPCTQIFLYFNLQIFTFNVCYKTNKYQTLTLGASTQSERDKWMDKIIYNLDFNLEGLGSATKLTWVQLKTGELLHIFAVFPRFMGIPKNTAD